MYTQLPIGYPVASCSSGDLCMYVVNLLLYQRPVNDLLLLLSLTLFPGFCQLHISPWQLPSAHTLLYGAWTCRDMALLLA